MTYTMYLSLAKILQAQILALDTVLDVSPDCSMPSHPRRESFWEHSGDIDHV